MERRQLIVVLVASVVLNVFLVGAAVAYLMLGPKLGHASHAHAQAIAAAERLDPEHRQPYRQMLKQQGRAAKPLFREAKLARRDAASLFAAQTYDRAAVAAALDRSRRAEFQGRAQLENAMLDFAAGLTPRERAALAVTLRRGLVGKGRPPRDDRRRPGPTTGEPPPAPAG